MRDHSQHLTDQELLGALDRELPAPRQAAAAAHLSWCAACRSRRARMADIANLVAVDRAESETPDERAALRERLEASLNQRAGESTRSWRARPWLPALLPRPLRTAALGVSAVAVVVFMLRLTDPSGRPPSASTSGVERDALPVASLTPGATWNLTWREVCASGEHEEQPISPAIRQQVLHDYGMERVPRSEYELDHLITPELGGAADPRNLWPQRYTSRVWNAHVKDQLEELLPQLVCDGRVTLETAQRDIALDWIAAYKKYFKTEVPIRTSAQLSMDDDGPRAAAAVFGAQARSPGAPRLELIAFSTSR